MSFRIKKKTELFAGHIKEITQLKIFLIPPLSKTENEKSKKIKIQNLNLNEKSLSNNMSSGYFYNFL